MNDESEIIKDLVVSGAIGAALGILITDDSQEGAIVGAIAGMALFATFKANNDAKKTQVPFFEQQNNVLYRIDANGEKHFFKMIEKSTVKLEKQFILK